jgi:hypothetical protein
MPALDEDVFAWGHNNPTRLGVVRTSGLTVILPDTIKNQS